MNKMIALFCAAVIAVSSSAAIVMADEAETNDSVSVSDVTDVSSDDSGSGDSGSDAGDEGGDNSTDVDTDTSIDENSDVLSENSSDADTEGEKESDADTEDKKESDADAEDKKESDADTEDKKESDADGKASETETDKDAEQPAASEAPAEENATEANASKSSGGGGGVAESATTADPSSTGEPNATADPSSTAEPAATADPSATAEPTATEKPAENKEKADEKPVVVMKRPFTLVKSYDTNPFDDCQSGWFVNYVSFAYANKIIVGYSNNAFDPFGKITGSQLAVMLYRISTGRTDIVTEGDGWSDEAIAWVKANKIMSDFADDDFDTDTYLTREEIICSFYRAYKLYNKAEEGGKIDNEKFPDAGDISEFALPAMEWAVASKIITGKSDKWIDPTSNVTRAEASAIFKRYLENLEFEDVPVEVKSTSSQKAKTEDEKDTAE